MSNLNPFVMHQVLSARCTAFANHNIFCRRIYLQGRQAWPWETQALNLPQTREQGEGGWEIRVGFWFMGRVLRKQRWCAFRGDL
jgi:hypothetical protein